MNIIYLFELNQKIGLGHFSRGLSLARSLIKNNHKCDLATIENINFKKEFYKYLNQFDIPYFNFNGFDLFEIHLRKEKFDYVIIDFANYERYKENKLINIIKKYSLLICIDDITKRRLKADINFYPPINWVKNLDWDLFLGKNFIGKEYTVLRPDLERYKNKSDSNYEYKYDYCITIGGSDPNSISIKIANLIYEISPHKNICIIYGPLYKKNISLKRNNISIFYNPDNYIEIITNSQKIITSFGVTMYELDYLKKQTYFFVSHEDHILSAEYFINLPNFKYLGFYKNLSKKTFEETLEKEFKKFTFKENTLINSKIIKRLIERLSD